MTMATILARLEGVRSCAGGRVARCPAHDDRRPSLSIREGDGGKPLLYCHAGCSYKSIIAALSGRSWPHVLGLSAASLGAIRSDVERIEFARRIWRQTQSAIGTPVVNYLRGRGITITPPRALRFHPALRHPTGIIAPAMVGGVQDRAGNFIAVHRTYLARDGLGKAAVDPKAALGPISGGAVRLAPAGEFLALSEGIETGLSILQATGVAVWVTLGTSNLAKVKLPECVRELIICADSDESGARAAQAAADCFLREGRVVRIAHPPAGADFNDLLQTTAV